LEILSEKCLRHIENSSREPEFLQLKVEDIKKIIENHPQWLSNDLELFLRIVEWSKEECKRQFLAVTEENQRKFLNNIAQHFKFSMDQIENSITPLHLFSHSELLDMLKL